MQISAPKVKYEVNLNTIIVLVGFASTSLAGGSVWGNITTRIANIEASSVDRATQQAASMSNLSTRIDSMDVELRKYDNLSYRITIQEQGSASLAKSVEELKAAVNSQGADVRVIREILTRQDRDVMRGDGKP